VSDIWAYPYRFGITLFLIGGTGLLVAFFIGIAIWLEKSFKNDKLNNK